MDTDEMQEAFSVSSNSPERLDAGILQHRDSLHSSGGEGERKMPRVRLHEINFDTKLLWQTNFQHLA